MTIRYGNIIRVRIVISEISSGFVLSVKNGVMSGASRIPSSVKTVVKKEISVNVALRNSFVSCFFEGRKDRKNSVIPCASVPVFGVVPD